MVVRLYTQERSVTADDAVKPIEEFREYLVVLARLHREILVEARVDPSDIVQMTLLKAHQRRDQFRGSGREQAAWMRQILTNTMIDAIRKARPGAGPHERSLEAALEQSSRRLEALFQDRRTSPGAQGDRNESLVGLARALSELPEDQRSAIDLRYLQGLPIHEIGLRMGRSTGSVGGLLQRGLRRLRELLQDE
jgi:RNA polymerase sigma-70 factor (ECF subfamily)